MYDARGGDRSPRRVNKLRTGTNVALTASVIDAVCKCWFINRKKTLGSFLWECELEPCVGHYLVSSAGDAG